MGRYTLVSVVYAYHSSDCSLAFIFHSKLAVFDFD